MSKLHFYREEIKRVDFSLSKHRIIIVQIVLRMISTELKSKYIQSSLCKIPEEEKN